MKKNLMRVILAALLMVMLCAASAGAVTFEKILEDDFSWTLPVGLYADVDYSEENGTLTVTVDAAQTKWDVLAANASGQKNVRINLTVKNSGELRTNLGMGMTTGDMFEDMEGRAAELLEEISFISQIFPPRPEGSNILPICEFNEETNSLIPTDYRGKNVYFCVVNTDESMQNVSYRYAKLVVTFSNYGAHTVDPAVPQESITPDSRIDSENYAVTKGRVTYNLPNDSTVNEIVTSVAAPEGAVKVQYKLGQGTQEFSEETVSDGKFDVKVNVPGGEDSQHTDTVILIWHGEKDVILAQRIVIDVKRGQPKPFPYYYENNWAIPVTAVPEGRLEMGQSRNGAKISVPFIEYEYDAIERSTQAIVKRKQNASPTMDMNLDNVMVSAVVKAPDEAQRYRFICGEYSPAYGSDGGNATLYNILQNELSGNNEWETVKDDQAVLNDLWDLFDTMERYDDPGLSIYYAHESPENGACIVFIEWEMQDGTMKREWFAFCYDQISFVSEGDIAETLPDDAVENPLLIPEGASARTGADLTLNVDTVPQLSKEGNQVQYDVSLVDADGETVKLNSVMNRAQLVFPVPEGAQEDMVITINHYKDADSKKADETLSTADGSLEWTDAGLVGTVKSLSPFVISWGYEDASGVENLPSTGDERLPLFALMALAVSSIAALIVMRRKGVKQN